tara:strand:- start:1200 stop:1607 length:408 start_codon:yes stop_codon:yes gene_type:complete
MMFIGIVPGQCLAILYRNSMSSYSIYEKFNLKIFDNYKYLKAKCAIIDNGSVFQIGRWTGILDTYNWEYEVIESKRWMDYFGLWPDDPVLMDKHWINVVKYRYPMLPVKKDTYEAILVSCYLHDRKNNESVGAFA